MPQCVLDGRVALQVAMIQILVHTSREHVEDIKRGALRLRTRAAALKCQNSACSSHVLLCTVVLC